jgi:RimJ/RimL family protein N-acetyltransferase
MIGMALETERLILDAWQSADWAAFRPIATDVEVMRYITGGVPRSDERIQAFVGRQMELYRTRGRIMEKLGLEFECGFESDGVRLVRNAIHRAQYATVHYS